MTECLGAALSSHCHRSCVSVCVYFTLHLLGAMLTTRFTLSIILPVETNLRPREAQSVTLENTVEVPFNCIFF